MDIFVIPSLILFIAVVLVVRLSVAITGLFSSSTPSKDVVVYTLPYSHFCEKAFWALDRSNIPYEEKGLSVAFMHPSLSKFGSSTVPLMVKDGEVTKDSRDILLKLHQEGQDWLNCDSPAVQEINSKLGDEFGRAAFRLVYYYLFTSDKGNELLKRVFKVKIEGVERALVDPLYPAARFVMMKSMTFDKSLPKYSAAIDEVFDYISSLLEDGREFLANTPTPSSADITFASLAYPLILPEAKKDVFMSFEEDIPEALREEVEKRRATLAGKFVLKMFENYRQ